MIIGPVTSWLLSRGFRRFLKEILDVADPSIDLLERCQNFDQHFFGTCSTAQERLRRFLVFRLSQSRGVCG